MKRRFNILFAAAVLISCLYACKEDAIERPMTNREQAPIAEYLANREDLSLFNEMVSYASKPQNYKNDYDSAAWIPVYDKVNKDSIITWVPDSIEGAISYAALIASRGSYTLFVPNNEAVKAYLAKYKYQSVADFNTKNHAELTRLVDYHLLCTQVTMTSQVSGAMNVGDTTSIGLRHFIDNNSASDIILDKVAKLENKIPKETYNGYVYVIDAVLEPHANNLKDAMNGFKEADGSGKYDIMAAAFEHVGLTDTLLAMVRVPHRDSSRRVNSRYELQFNTLLAVPDEVYEAAGINSWEDLRDFAANPANNDIAQDTAYSNHHSMEPDTLLKAYLLYHVLPGAVDLDRNGDDIYYYGLTTAQMVNERDMATMVRAYFPNVLGYTWRTTAGNVAAPRPVLTDGEGTSADINYVNSDCYTKNGYLHELDGVLKMKKNTKEITTGTVLKYELEDFFFRYSSALGTRWTANTPVSTFNTNSEEEDNVWYSSNQRLTTAKPSAGDFAVGKAIKMNGAKQNTWYEFVVRDLAPSPTGKYLLRLNYYSEEGATENTLVYWYDKREEFDPIKKRLKISPLNLSDYKKKIYYGEPDSVTGKPSMWIEVPVYPEYQQNRLVGLVETKDEVADYALRFLHVEAKGATYDSFTLEPCTDEQFKEIQASEGK